MDNVETSPLALITGGSRGLGRALVLALLDRSWTVVTDGRNSDALADLAETAFDHAGSLVTIGGDVTNSSHRAELVAHVESAGRLDVLVNNASTLGVTPLASLSQQPGSALLDVMDGTGIAMWWQGDVVIRGVAPEESDPEILKRLRALGYVQ